MFITVSFVYIVSVMQRSCTVLHRLGQAFLKELLETKTDLYTTLQYLYKIFIGAYQLTWGLLNDPVTGKLAVVLSTDNEILTPSHSHISRKLC